MRLAIDDVFQASNRMFPGTPPRSTRTPSTTCLAKDFHRVIREWLTRGQLAEVEKRNATPRYRESGSCATHDFCDANMAMAEAWMNLTGGEPDFGEGEDRDQEICDVINAAWDKARRHGFDKEWRWL